MQNRFISKGQSWIDRIFDAKQAKNGGIVRRSIKTALRFTTEAALIAAVLARGFHIVRAEKQYIIFCGGGHFELLH